MENNPLLDLMSKQIASQRETLLAEARDEAEQIRQDGQQQAEQRRSTTLDAVKSELASLAARSRERVEAEAHMVTLTTKDSIANEVLDSVESALAAHAASPEFSRTLEALLAELMADSPEDVVVLAPEAHVDHCKQWLASHGRDGLPVEALPGLTDGVAIQDPDRKFRYTNTLTARFRLQEGSLRKYALHQLFPEANSGAEG
jgi:vacuolar-type H+-ATPase subunit E/Vma4